MPNPPDAPDTNGSTDAPGLTLGQKLLLKLPDLKRTPSERPAQRTRTPRAASGEAPEASLVGPEPEVTSAKAGPSKAAPSSTSRKGAPSPYDNMSTKELTELHKRLDNRDRLIATIAAPLGAVVSVIETLSSLHNDPALHHKGYLAHSTIIDTGVVVLVICALALVTARTRRRTMTAFALMFIGIPLGPLSLGLPFILAGGYLIFKMLKVQKVLTARGVERPSNRRAPARTSASADKKASPVKGTSKKTPPSGTRAPQSKRYTPPKPLPKRPPPPKAEADEKAKRPNWLERATERSEQRAATRAEKSEST